jgi:hypothetical protein
MNESNLTLRQWLRVNSERVAAFIIGAVVMGLFYGLIFITWTAGT